MAEGKLNPKGWAIDPVFVPPAVLSHWESLRHCPRPSQAGQGEGQDETSKALELAIQEFISHYPLAW